MLREELLYQDALATLVRHPAGYARLDWELAPMVSGHLRSLFEKLPALLRPAGLTKLLTDCHTLPPLWPADCAWLSRQWAPQMAPRAGCTHVAIVATTEQLPLSSRASAAEWLATAPLCVAYFEALEQAELWLGDA